MKLTIKRQSDRYHIAFDDQGAVTETFNLDFKEVHQIRKQTKLLGDFLNSYTAYRHQTDFIAAGQAIYQRFFGSLKAFEPVLHKTMLSIEPTVLEIQAEDYEILSLPWELLYTPDFGFLTVQPQFQLIRTLNHGIMSDRDNQLSAGPLRILFMAYSPEDVHPLLNYEREEEIILDALSGLKRQKALQIDIAECGTLEELKNMLAQEEYHVVHLSGHGRYDESSSTGYLSMESELGIERKVSAKELASTLTGHKSIRLLFLSACESARETEPYTGLASQLILRGVPMAIAMRYPVKERAATELAESFYKNLALKHTVSESLQLARKAYFDKYSSFGNDFQWSIPALFTRDSNCALVDWKASLKPIEEKSPASVILYGKVSHLKTGFRGRRKEQRDYLRRLRQGESAALCITGSGGIGKSTLASRLTDRLHGSGYMIVPLYGEITPDRFIEKTISTLVTYKEKEHREEVKSLVDYEDRIAYVLSNIIGTRDMLYLFDNFEDNLEKSTGYKTLKNPFWEETFKNLLEQIKHTNSRILITCRYRIESLSDDLLYQRPLKELSEGEARKLMEFNTEFKSISPAKLKEVYQFIGGNPKAIGDLGKLLSEPMLSWDEVKEKLKQVAKNMREFTLFEELYNFLTEAEQDFFRRISVYQAPVEIEALSIQIPSDLTALINKLLRYSLVQAYDDTVFTKTYYQVHPLNRNHIKETW